MTDGIPELGRLVDIAPRLAWNHEAQVFTPWLFANLDRLGEELGLMLEPIETEVRIGKFAADIIARDKGSDSVVLIENQLEESDHTHLGQVLTYLAGRDPKIIVWVAPKFSEPHLAALSWLNRNTPVEYSFFAVQLRLVRIGDSPMAPLFDVLEKPNDWERRERSRAREAGQTNEIAAGRYKFWDAYAARRPDADLTVKVGHSVRWRIIPGTDVVLSRFVSKNEVGVFVRGTTEADASVKDRLRLAAAELEPRLGAPIGTTYPFIKTLAGDTADPERWPALIDWLETETQRYEAAIAPIFSANPSSE